MQDDKLLIQYARDGSEAAFGRLVARHLTLVYSTCLRETGSPSQAEDAAQVVFLLLARKAKSLRAGPSLAGWLYKAARFVAKDVRKQEARRRLREERVMQEEMHRSEPFAPEWEGVEPLLNDALSALKPGEREAVLLRFMEGHTLAETGATLGLSEDAARMRVARAVEKMRRHLTAHGAAVTGVVLTGYLVSEAARPGPADAAAITQATLQAVATGPTANVLLLSKGVYQTMKIIKVKIAVLAAVLVSVGSALPPLARAISPHKASVEMAAAPVPQSVPVPPVPQAEPIAPAPKAGPTAPAPQAEPIAPTPQSEPAAPTPQAEPATPAPQSEPVAPAPPARPVAPAPQAEPAVPSSKSPTAADVDLLQAMEHYRLVIVGYRAGANTSADLSEATLALAEARLRVAQSKPDEVLQNLETIEAQRAEMLRLATVGYRAGAAGYTSANVKKANVVLIEAKVRVNLYKAVMSQSGADLKQSVDAAVADLQAARDQYADVQEGSAKSGAR